MEILNKQQNSTCVINNNHSLIYSKFLFKYYYLNLNDTYKYNKYIRGATASKSQNRLKRLLPDGSTGALVVSKALIPQP